MTTSLTAQQTDSVEVGRVNPDSSGPLQILDLIHLAIEKGIPVEALERLQAMHERAADRAAAAEFARALALFQAKCPPISKNALAQIVTSGGSKFTYKYAELDHIARVVGPILQEVGLSYSWDSEMAEKMVRCTCILRHVSGHSTTASFSCPPESRAGMSEQQKHAAALSYARRQSLVQVLGLTTCDPDTDGANPETVSEDQVIALDDLIKELQVDKARFLRHMGVAALAEIPARNYDAAVVSIKSVAAARARREGAR